jgi:hypothetical protein
VVITADLSRERPVALVWLRHYGCLYCRADGTVAWSHMAQDASDNAEPHEILAAVRAA